MVILKLKILYHFWFSLSAWKRLLFQYSLDKKIFYFKVLIKKLSDSFSFFLYHFVSTEEHKHLSKPLVARW